MPAISVALIRNHCSERQLRQFIHQYEIKQQPLSMGLLSWVHLYWNQFICIVRCNHASRQHVGVPWKSVRGLHQARHIWEGEKEREGETQRRKERERAQTVKLLPISSWGKVTYRKSNRVNERSSANQIAYLNHLGNIQQLIKHSVLRPQFHILSCTALTQAEALQITMRDVIIANVSSQMYH